MSELKKDNTERINQLRERLAQIKFKKFALPKYVLQNEFGPFYKTLSLEEQNKSIEMYERKNAKLVLQNQSRECPVEIYNLRCDLSGKLKANPNVTHHDLKVILQASVRNFTQKQQLWNPNGKLFRFPQMNYKVVVPILILFNLRQLPSFGCSEEQVKYMEELALMEYHNMDSEMIRKLSD